MFHGPGVDADHNFESDLVGKERRATDRVVKIWQHAADKKAILANLDRSLWQYCFLMVMDELPECSVIVDHGRRAGQGLQLIDDRNGQTLKKIPRYLGDRIFSLGQKCVRNRKPVRHSQNRRRSPESPVERYRLALLPLRTDEDISPNPVRSVLGVFTYQ